MTRRDSTFERVLDELGAAIATGELPAGHTTSVERCTERTVSSRSVVREVTRVLTSLGMLHASPRIGLSVQPAAQWDVLDPLVIRWRLRGPARAQQVRELRQLRRAVEPAAAAAAAEAVARGGPDVAADLRRLTTAADTLAAVAVDGTSETFLLADQELHTAVLALAGNAMFSRLGAVIAEALRERANERREEAPDVHDVQLHGVLVRTIGRGDAAGAARAVREIVERATPR